MGSRVPLQTPTGEASGEEHPGRSLRWRRVAGELRSGIDAGRPGPGELLASEADLVRRFDVSRDTVRRALDHLREEGLLESRQGAGWRVVGPRPDVLRLDVLASIESRLGASGHVSERRVLAVRHRRPPRWVATSLGTRQVTCLERLHLADGRPFALVTAWWPTGLYAALEPSEMERFSLLDLLPVGWGGATQTIGAAGAAEGEAVLLGVDRGSPLLVVERETRDSTGTTVLLSRQLFPGASARFTVEVPGPVEGPGQRT